MTPTPYRYVYLHGFASSSRAYKGTKLAEAFAATTHTSLLLPDLNIPSFSTMTWTAILAFLDEFDRSEQDANAPFTWRIIGSSMGGYLAALWASLNPSRVDRIVLLCPGFEMVARWPSIFGEETLAYWEKHGSLNVPVYTSPTPTPTPLHWGFFENAKTHPPRPVTPCPTRILHGTHDSTVPIGSSRDYAALHPHVSLRELDTDHGMVSALTEICSEISTFFDLKDLSIENA